MSDASAAIKISGPDFVGIGLERSGTSWMFKQLAAHPEIWTPPLKELHYFDCLQKKTMRDDPRYRRHLFARMRQRAAFLRTIIKRPELYKNNAWQQLHWDLSYFGGAKNDAWYARLFAPSFVRGRVAGEVTPAYGVLSPDDIAGITKRFARTKFILLARHPYDRLRSGVLHHFRVEQGRDFKSVTKQEMLDYVAAAQVREKSSLATIVKNWQTHLEPSRLFIGYHADIQGAPESFLRALYEFVGVDENFVPAPDILQAKPNAQEDVKLPESVERAITEFAEEQMELLRADNPDIAQQLEA